MNKKILIVTDNGFLYKEIIEILKNEFPDLLSLFEFRRSKQSKKHHLYSDGIDALEEVDMKANYSYILSDYDMVISIHCKQIFPADLVNNIVCINIHPGLNPYNRGWYPQVFAILGENKLGATIHIMDEQVDHGAIIDREEVEIERYYTSKEAYEEVLKAELNLFRKNIRNIVQGTYVVTEPEFEGDYHSIEDYNKLCQLNLSEKITLGEAIDKFRALSHGAYKNAYFIDEKGNKIFVRIELEKMIEK